MSNPNMQDYDLKDGVYIETFVVKDGQRYNAKIISMSDVTKILVNGMVDGVGKLLDIDDVTSNT